MNTQEIIDNISNKTDYKYQEELENEVESLIWKEFEYYWNKILVKSMYKYYELYLYERYKIKCVYNIEYLDWDRKWKTTLMPNYALANSEELKKETIWK